MNAILGKVAQRRQHIPKVGEGTERYLLPTALVSKETMGKDNIRPGCRLKVGTAIADVDDVAALPLVFLYDQTLGIASVLFARIGMIVMVGNPLRGEPGIDGIDRHLRESLFLQQGLDVEVQPLADDSHRNAMLLAVEP